MSVSTGQCKTQTGDRAEMQTEGKIQTADYTLFKYISKVLFPLSISNWKQGSD